MPELPEVETVRRGLIPRLEGRRVTRLVQRRDNLRVALPERFAARVEGRRIDALHRRAKYLLLRLDDGQTLVIHLGMSGRMTLVPSREANARPFDTHDHVVFEVDDGWQVRFNDARRFGLMLLLPTIDLDAHKLFRHLGPEPLEAAFDAASFAARLAGKRTPIKSALLDQTVLVGVGNIYACEALHMAGVSPRRMASTIRGERAARLLGAIKTVLERSILDGGSTLRDHAQPDGELGYFQTRFAVYDKEGQPCPGCDCGKGVRRFVQAGRSTFWCPSRQK